MKVWTLNPVLRVSGSAPPKLASGVGHGEPVEALPDMGGVHGESRDIDAPAGVVFSRQIRAHSVEPTIASRSRNLFSHDDRWPSGADEAKEVGPQMPNVVDTGTFPRDREGLAGTRAGPQGLAVWPSSEPGRDTPQSAAGEEMTLGKSVEVGRLNISN
jgi:hypothetical protein